jgi:tetratricopeptide (TPR) repeat protein
VDFNLHLPAITMPAILFAAVLIITNPRTRYAHSAYPRFLKAAVNICCLVILLAVGSFFTASLFNQWADRMNSTRPARKAEIIGAYKKASLFNPWDSYYHQKLARIYARDFNQEGNVYAGALAILEYQKSILLNPEESDFYEELFYLFYQMGYPLAKIEEYFSLARRCAPYDVKMMTNMALIYFNRGNPTAAAGLLEKVITVEPNYLPAYYYLGLSKEALGQKPGAEIIYRKLLEINERGLARTAQSDYELKALEVPLAEVYQKLGVIYLAEKKYDAAVNSFQQAVQLNPLNATLRNSLAGAYFSLGRYQQALREAQTALKLDPQNETFQKNLALCLAAINKREK